MISDGQWDSVFGLGFGRLQGSFSADVVDTFQSIGDDRVWIVAFGKKIAHFVGFGREISVVILLSNLPGKFPLLALLFSTSTFLSKTMVSNMKCSIYPQIPPSQWIRNIILPLPKKGSLYEMTNYRGISLMSINAKVYNRILLNRIRPFVDPTLRHNQAGRKKLYTRNVHPQTLNGRGG